MYILPFAALSLGIRGTRTFDKPTSSQWFRYLSSLADITLTSSWSIKDFEKRYKTFPETHSGSSYELIVWVIMNHEAETPRSKSNAFRLPQYASQQWKKMISLGKYTIRRCWLMQLAKRNHIHLHRLYQRKVEIERVVKSNQRLMQNQRNLILRMICLPNLWR